VSGEAFPPGSDGVARFYAPDRASWRGWLEQNHRSAPRVWLVYYRKESGRPRVAYADAVEEALCFGWIDSRPSLLDELRSMQLFSPRKPKSGWSRLNKQRVERLLQAGLMTPAGLAAIDAAQRDGSWNALDAAEDLTMPDDLAAALAVNEAAQRHFAAFPPSSKKNIFGWIGSARRAETRAQRIAETVQLAAQNLRANHWRQ
jgi:uncharacterized protein YdeI (YjbR/CyaY-like superfamily)